MDPTHSALARDGDPMSKRGVRPDFAADQRGTTRARRVGTLAVVMGVSGAGKSTVGSQLADLLGIEFVDADDLHPGSNIAKMTAGLPLTDLDRIPWLDEVGRTLAGAPADGMVIACSALTRAYRDRIRVAAPSVFFVELDASVGLLTERLTARHGHFMPAGLLASQLDTLQPLQSDEDGVRIYLDENPNPTAGIARRLQNWASSRVVSI